MDHTVKSFDEELTRLSHALTTMGTMAERQFQMAITALMNRDEMVAARVVAADPELDELEREVQHQTIRMLALRQPMAADLRVVVAALKVSSALERIGDYAANVAKRSLILAQSPELPNLGAVVRLGHVVQEIIHDILDAYNAGDADKAVRVWMRDEEVDEAYSALFKSLVSYMTEDQSNITACTHLMFIAKNIERIGDHATNIAETLHYLVRGTTIEGNRPKANSVPEL